MKKNNKNGFILAETIAVSTVVLTSLVILYTQFVTINNSYSTSFKYNGINELFLTNNIREYIKEDGLDYLIKSLNTNSYIDFTDCSNEYFIEYIYCKTLLDTSSVKTILFTNENVDDLKKQTNIFNSKLSSFIQSINTSTGNGYRIIVEFENDNYATLKIDK